jgi:hypothetical protein
MPHRSVPSAKEGTTNTACPQTLEVYNRVQLNISITYTRIGEQLLCWRAKPILLL